MNGYVIVDTSNAPYLSAWMSPKGKAGAWNCNRWTTNPEQAFVYKTENAAEQALKRLQSQGYFSDTVVMNSAELLLKLGERQ